MDLRNRIRAVAIWAVPIAFGLLVLDPISAFFVAWLTERGVYAHPSATVSAGWAAFVALTHSVWFHLFVGATLGFAVGVWLDFTLRMRERQAVPTEAPSPGARDRRGPIYAAWDQIPALAFYEAACLWAEIEPDPSGAIPAAAYPWYKMLQKAGERGELPFTTNQLDRHHYGRPVPTPRSEVTRADLIKFAEANNFAPAFLFLQERRGAFV